MICKIQKNYINKFILKKLYTKYNQFILSFLNIFGKTLVLLLLL